MKNMKVEMEERAVKLNRILKEQGSSMEIEYTEQWSNNMDRQGYLLKCEGECIAPIVYVTPNIPDWWKSSDQEVADYFQYLKEDSSKLNLGELTNLLDKEYLLDHVYMAFVSNDGLEGMEKCHMVTDTWMDLGVKFYISLPARFIFPGSNGVIRMTHELKEKFQISKKELQEASLRNMEAQKKIVAMEDMLLASVPPEDREQLRRQMAVQETPEIYVVTNQEMCDGAASILLPSVVEEMKEHFGSRFAVLPSSRHEMLVVELHELDTDLTQLQHMVKEVNATEVEPEDFLSGKVYYYCNGEFHVYDRWAEA